jgi:POLQ-like helicase
VYTDPFRPVELKEYIKLGDSLLLVNSKDRRRDDILKNDRNLVITNGESRKTDPDGLAELVNEVAPNQSCKFTMFQKVKEKYLNVFYFLAGLVFCPTKKNCESVAQLISRNIKRSVLECKTVEKRRLWQALKVRSVFPLSKFSVLAFVILGGKRSSLSNFKVDDSIRHCIPSLGPHR